MISKVLNLNRQMNEFAVKDFETVGLALFVSSTWGC